MWRTMDCLDPKSVSTVSEVNMAFDWEGEVDFIK